DLYFTGSWKYRCAAYSIMDASYTTTHFDPFEKLKLGWLKPNLVTSSGEHELRDVETHSDSIILFDPARGPGEYFMLENRWRGKSYDAGMSDPNVTGGGIPADGLAVWDIVEAPALV